MFYDEIPVLQVSRAHHPAWNRVGHVRREDEVPGCTLRRRIERSGAAVYVRQASGRGENDLLNEGRGTRAAIIEDPGVVIVENTIGGPDDCPGGRLKSHADTRRDNAPLGGNDPVRIAFIALEEQTAKRIRKHGGLPAGNERHTLTVGLGGIEARLPADSQV